MDLVLLFLFLWFSSIAASIADGIWLFTDAEFSDSSLMGIVDLGSLISLSEVISFSSNELIVDDESSVSSDGGHLFSRSVAKPLSIGT